MKNFPDKADFADENRLLPVSISNKHLHLKQEQVEELFGAGYRLTIKKELSQPGQYAAEEAVHVVGPKGMINNVRIVGPARSYNQVELSLTDAIKLGIKAPLRNSGDIAGSASCVLVGPKGYVILNEGVVIAKPHIHLSVADGTALGIKDKDLVDIFFDGEKQAGYFGILARVGSEHERDVHIDTDEANAVALASGQKALLVKRDK